MKKLLMAAMAGVVLIASQAAAGSNSAILQAGDRVASQAPGAAKLEESADLWLLLLGAVVVVVIITQLNDDEPSSP